MVGAGDLIWLGTEKKAKKILFLHLIMASSLVIFALSFYWKNNMGRIEAEVNVRGMVQQENQ